jgi:hypothetical protein
VLILERRGCRRARIPICVARPSGPLTGVGDGRGQSRGKWTIASSENGDLALSLRHALRRTSGSCHTDSSLRPRESNAATAPSPRPSEDLRACHPIVPERATHFACATPFGGPQGVPPAALNLGNDSTFAVDWPRLVFALIPPARPEEFRESRKKCNHLSP